MTTLTTDFHFKYPGQAALVKESGRIGFRQEEFNSPWFLDTSPAGDIIVADTDNHRVQVLDSNTKLTLSFPYGFRGEHWGELRYPKSAKYSPFLNSHIIIADTGNRRLIMVKIRPDGFVQQCHTVGQNLLRQPTDVALDGPRNLMFVTDTSERAVLILDQNGNLVSKCRHGPELNQPTGITRDREGRIFVADSGNHTVQVYAPNGDFITRLGGFGTRIGEFNTPRGVCVDSKSRLFVADQLNDRVLMFGPDLRMVSEVVGGVPQPKGVAAHDRLFVTTADRYNTLKVYNV